MNTTKITTTTNESDATGERDESVEQDDDPGNPTRSAQPASLVRSFNGGAAKCVFVVDVTTGVRMVRC
jgi:hypothetical protein